MSSSSPPAEAQVAFLQNVQRLLAEGSFTATYKFALLQALADLAVLRGDDTDAVLTLSTGEIAEAMIRLYWRQAVPFPGADGDEILRQNTNGQAAIITMILQTREMAEGSLVKLQTTPHDWERLIRAVAQVVREMPLWRLQQAGNERLDFLYPHDPGATKVTLQPGVAYCLRAFHGLISEIVRGAWIRFVRRQNVVRIGETADLGAFLFGTERGNLGPLQPILKDLQLGLCFYCRRPIHGPGEVDHFIPWSRYPVDLGHNFVLAHASCNQAKSRYLAAVRHLESWVERGVLQGVDLTAALRGLNLEHNAAVSARVAWWVYGQTENVGGQVWSHDRTLESLPPTWRSVLPG